MFKQVVMIIFVWQVDNFQNLWNKFVGSSLDFSVFKTVFPPVPRQDYEYVFYSYLFCLLVLFSFQNNRNLVSLFVGLILEYLL